MMIMKIKCIKHYRKHIKTGKLLQKVQTIIVWHGAFLPLIPFGIFSRIMTYMTVYLICLFMNINKNLEIDEKA